MRWLWKDWPGPVKAGAGSPQLQEILVPGEGWTLVAEGYKFTEGPAANAKGEVFFNDIPNSKTYKIGLDGKVSLFLADTKQGQRPGVRPRRPALRRRRRHRADPRLRRRPASRTVIADGFRGNDLVVRHDGSIYVTNPAANGTEPSKVWYISPKGEKRVVDTGLKFSNGITLSPDQSLLYVADSRSHWVYSYQIQPDGSLADKQRYYPPARARHGRRQRRRRHARRPRRPALCGDAHGHPGLRPGRPRQLHHPHAQRQGRQPLLRRRELRHALRHLRRPRLQTPRQNPRRQCLCGADKADPAPTVSAAGLFGHFLALRGATSATRSCG